MAMDDIAEELRSRGLGGKFVNSVLAAANVRTILRYLILPIYLYFGIHTVETSQS